jgi:integrase
MRVYSRAGVYWVQADGRRRSLKTRDKKLAHTRANELWRRTADPGYKTANKAVFREALARYSDDRRRAGRAAGTLRMIGIHAAHIARILGDETDLRTVGAPEVDGYISRRELEGAKPHTVYKELTTLRGVLRLAKRRGEYAGDLDETFPEYSRKWTPGTRALTRAQVLALLAALPARRRALVAFIVATAADLENAFAARPGDVDLKRWRVIVHGTKTTARRRVVPVPTPFRPFLEEAAAYLPFDPWGNVRRDLEVACRRAEVPYVSPRDLRRSCAKILRNEYNVEPSLLSPILGHADSRMVETVYGKLEVDALERMLEERTAPKPAQKKRSAGTRKTA